MPRKRAISIRFAALALVVLAGVGCSGGSGPSATPAGAGVVINDTPADSTPSPGSESGTDDSASEPEGNAPTAGNKTVNTTQGQPVSISVLDSARLSVASFTAPFFGTVVVNDAGTSTDLSDDYLVYTPVGGYIGPDTFFYTLTDSVATATAAVNVQVSPVPMEATPPNVGGQVIKGPVRGAQIRLYEMSPGGDRVGVPVGAAITDEHGEWEMSLPTSRKPLLVVASAGSYDDETQTVGSRTINLGDNDELMAVLPADESFVVTSVYSSALYQRARYTAAGRAFNAAYAAARAASVSAWGFDLSATKAADPAAPDATGPVDARTHALALGGAANALDRIVTRLGMSVPNGAAIDALVTDLSDCTLDGRGFNGPVQLLVNGSELAIDGGIDLDLEVLRFRNNRFDAYSSTPIPRWNTAPCIVAPPPADLQPPVVTVDRQRVSSTSPTLSGSVSDPRADVRVTVAGTTYAAGNFGNVWTLNTGVISPALADGVYDVLVTAADQAGNIGIDVTSNELVIDSGAPAVTVNAFASGTNLSGTVDDPGASVNARINGIEYSATVVGNVWTIASTDFIPSLTEGSYAIVVTATDSAGNIATVTRSAAVQVSVNQPPGFSVSGDIVVDEDFTGARLVEVVPDPVLPQESSQSVVYSLNPSAVAFANVSIDSDTGRVYVTAVPGAFGSRAFTIVADDGQPYANFAARSFTLTVNPINTAPGFAVSHDIVENQDFAGVRVVTATPVPVNADEAGQTVSYSLSPVSVPFANISFDAATGTVEITAVAGASGSQVFTLTANDGQAVNATASASFTLTVNPTVAGNAVPTITGQLPLTTPEDVPLTIFLSDLTVADPDNAYPADFSLAVQPGGNYTVIGNTLTPVRNYSGMLTVPLVVNDGQSSSALYNASVNVTSLNDAPLFSLSGNVVELEGFSGAREVSVLPGDVPADETAQSVTYSLSPPSVSFAAVAIDSSTGLITVTSVAGQSGSQVFTVTADDGQGVNNIATASFSVTVTATDDAPTTSGIADISVLEDAAPVVVDLFAAFADSEDADADMNYAIAGNTNPALFQSLSVDGTAGTLTLAFAANASGTAKLTVRATDTAGNTADAVFDVIVNAQADLRIASLSPSSASPGIGQTVNFMLVLQNAGPSRATDVTVNVPLPVGYTYVTANNPGEYNSVTGDWYRSAINGTSTLVLTAEVNATGPYEVTAEVVAVNEPDPNSTPGNNNPAEDDQRSTTTTPRPVTDLEISVSVDDPVPAPDGLVGITVLIENHGPYDATGVTVSVPPLAGELSYESATPGAGSFSLAGGQWSGFNLPWSGDPLFPQSATLTLSARVSASVPVSTVLETVAELTALNELEADGIEKDAAAILVLADGIDHEWLGGAAPDPVDWNNPDNWDTGLVPSPGDNVSIAATGFEPVLGADVLSLAELDIESGTQVWANGFIISVVGTLDARDGPVNGPGLVRMEFGKLRGSVPALEIAAASPAVEVSAHGDITIATDLTVAQGKFATEGETVNVGGNLLSTGNGILMQTSGSSTVIVQGEARFEGGDYSNEVNRKFPLSGGRLFVAGNFFQTGHVHSFAAEEDHLVVFNGSGPQTVFMQNPDSSNPDPDLPAQTGSRFANLRIDKHAANDGAVTLLSDVAVLRSLEQPLVGKAGIAAAPSSGFALTIGGADLDTPLYPLTHNLVFDNVPLTVLQGDSLHHLDGLVFTNMDRAVPQLRMVRRSLDGASILEGIAFETLPDLAAGGRYIVFENIHPDANKNLTLELRQSLPAYGQPLTEVIGNASIVWGAGNEDSDRDGLTDADEFTAGTNPFTNDSDADGLADPDEMARGTDAFNSDSDGDGIGDGAEVAADGNPLSAAVPGTVLYVRPAPLGNDANTGFGGWGDALASNAAVQAAMLDGAGPGQPFYVLYDAGVYGPLEIDQFANVSLIGSLAPGTAVPSAVPTSLFDASSTANVPVVSVLDSTDIRLQSVTLTGSSNFAGGGDGGLGGGLFVDDTSTVSVFAAAIEHNVAAEAGGGVYVKSGGYVEITSTSIAHNRVPAGGVGGGGVAAVGGLAMVDSMVADNRYEGSDPLGGGGGLYLEPESAPVMVRNSRFLANYSASSGGGIQLARANTPVTLFNNLIVGNANDADLGGGIAGIRLDRGYTTLIESNTVAFNRSLTDTDSAGGIHIDRGDDAEVRDNIVWYNVDADAVDELQDQFVDEQGATFYEFNNFEDFGPGDLLGNDDGDPHFEAGFYLRGDSKSLDAGSRTAAAAGLGLPFTVAIDGAEDLGVLDQGYHYGAVAEGESYAATLVGESAVCATDTVTLFFSIAAVGGDLGPGHVVAVRVDGDDTAGGSLQTLTGIEPYGWSGSQLAIDEGNGVYRVDITGVAHGSNETVVLQIKVDNDDAVELRSSDLTVLFAGEGC